MAKCRQCNVTISDNTTVCPLCQCVLEVDRGPAAAGRKAPVQRQHPLNEYPDVWLKQQRIKHLCNLILVGVLAASAVLAVVNFAFSRDSWWSLIPIAAMGYVYMAFRVIFVSKRGYRWKTFIPLILGLLLLLIIDLETGFYGWSLNYVFPAGILVTDMIIVILMLTNLKNWQSYIVMEIVTMAVSLIPMALWIAGIITNPLLSVIALVVTASLFVAALILGDRTARGELKRRFHIR